MTIKQTTSVRTTLSRDGESRDNSHPVSVNREERAFVLDGQLEEFIPSHYEGDVRTLQ